ncbi:hypothetical protein NIES4101_40360 [Calothrix sp. NIES-4101]|nr:hypothetical protein NIES4101_40360 [Calothrix sp. NIES-4101]
MKASETTLRNLLEGGKQFQIPLFQRPYSWQKEHWETLWGDLMKIYNDEVKGSYFLGPIVTQAELGTADGITPFVVVDGQQRLTTLSILLASLRTFLKKVDKQISEQINEFYLINKYQKGDEFYKILPTQDDCDVYKSLINNKSIKDIKKGGQIYDAYKFFDSKLKKPDPEEEIELDYLKLKNIVLECLVLVNITTDSSDNPYLIFESLNNKGEDLSQADLVRNYLFMNLPKEKREDVYNNDWLPLQNSFKQKMEKLYAKELTNAFWFYLRKDGESISEKSVYQTIKKRFDVFKNDNKKFYEELKKLIQFAYYYLRLNFPENEPEYSLKQRHERLKRLDFTTCHIFLLNIYHDYETNKISLDDFKEIIDILESYFVRRWLCKISTRALSQIFDNLYKQIIESKPDNLVSGLRSVLISYTGNKVFPDDILFCQALIEEQLYNSKSSTANDRVKFLLENIEKTLSKEQVITKELTIEHVMPQTLTQPWKNMLGTSHMSIKTKWLHTLGNLTLTAYNAELSNKPFDEKVKYFTNKSNVSLNKYFHKLEMWNEEEIKKRGKYLANIAIKRWSR